MHYQSLMKLTFFGFHLVTFEMPYEAANCPSRCFVSTSDIGIEVRFGRPSRAGCWNGVRSYGSGMEVCVAVLRGEWRRANVP